VLEIKVMVTSADANPSHSVIPMWYKIGAVLVLMVMVVLFLVFAGVAERHRLYDEAPPGGAVPGKPNPVLPQ
jgi:hypothetical protein